MNRNRLIIGLGAVVLLVVLALTTRIALALSAASANEERSNAAYGARWQALAQSYVDSARQRADAAYGARWQAIAQQYADSARERADAAYAARWQGLAQLYPTPSAGTVSVTAADAEAARWTALALQEYQRTGDHKYLPQCIPARVMAMLPRIGDNLWRSLVPTCGQ